MPVVDTHTHFIPLEFVDRIRAGDGPRGVTIRDEEGSLPVIVHGPSLAHPVFPVFHDADAKLEQMDRDGIDISLVSVTPPLFLYWMDPEETARAARSLNDGAAALVERGRNRIEALATVPMNDPEEAARELRRAREELGLVGVEIGTSLGETQLDDASLDPFFAAAEELGMPVTLHPYLSMVSAPAPPLHGYYLANVIGNPLETFVAASRLIVGGVLDRHPGLVVHLVHGGGSFPYQLGRLEHAYHARGDQQTAQRNPMSYLDNFLFDTVVFDARCVDFLLELAGPDRVVFGSDIPFEMADTSALRSRARLDPEVEEKVLGENALRAYGLTSVPSS